MTERVDASAGQEVSLKVLSSQTGKRFHRMGTEQSDRQENSHARGVYIELQQAAERLRHLQERGKIILILTYCVIIERKGRSEAPI